MGNGSSAEGGAAGSPSGSRGAPEGGSRPSSRAVAFPSAAGAKRIGRNMPWMALALPAAPGARPDLNGKISKSFSAGVDRLFVPGFDFP